MTDTDVAIVGAGAAGAALAAILGRRALRVVVIEPTATMAPRFRAEKIEPDQAALLRKHGLLDALLPMTARIRTIREARAGRRLRRLTLEQYGICYHDLVNGLRAQIPPRVELRRARLAGLAGGDQEQLLRLDDGGSLSARLVALACGLGRGQQAAFGLTPRMASPGHSLHFGFDVAGAGPRDFGADSLTCFGGSVAAAIDALTLFPIRDQLRANLFTYWPARDPRVRACIDDPVGLLRRELPGLERLAPGLRCDGPVASFPIDLYRVEGHLRPGLVLLGDVFQSVCPATGTGLSKVLTDVDCLVSRHLPGWLATPGMALDKIAGFYDDPEKRACDDGSLALALKMRRTTLDPGLRWRLQRLARNLKKRLQASLSQAREDAEAG